jgi:diguanylate cyclase
MRKLRLSDRLRAIAGHRAGGPLLVLSGTAAGYLLLAEGGYQLVHAGSEISAFWPPNGLVVALLVLLPRRLLPWVLAAVVPAELAADLLQGIPVLTSLGWGGENIVEALVAAAVFVRVARRRPLGDKQRDFVALAVAAVTAPAIGALIGAEVSCATWGGSYPHAWVTWWLADGTGMVLVVPLVL